MPAELIDGKIVSEKVRAAAAAAVARLPGKPCLAVVLVGEDPASQIYVKSKGEKTEAAGMRSITMRLPASATQGEVETVLTKFPNWVENADEQRRLRLNLYKPVIKLPDEQRKAAVEQIMQVLEQTAGD